jgi:glycosyltransferase involved in cell wall biosynthesis
LKNLPPSLANRVHYLFATKGTAWHPNPSGVEIHKFLTRIRRMVRTRYLMHLRGPAGFWPVQRTVDPKRAVFPLLDCMWSSGAPSNETEFSVVIPSFDSGSSLVKVLTALRAQSISPTRFEVLVMDDGSSDGTLEMIKGMGDSPFHLRYFYWPRPAKREEQSDFRAGLIRNLGVSHSRGEFLCFLDSDILVPPDYLSDLERRFESNDVIQARRDMLTQEASRSASAYKAFAPGDVYPDDSYWETFKSLDSWSQTPQFWKYTCTYALSLRKDLFLKAGWFSPEFFSYGFEDVDLGYRLYKLGARFHLSQNVVFHLYPERSELNYHFDEEKRTHALTLSSRVFFRNRLDPEIFNEFYPAYYEPLAGKLWINVMQPALKPYYFTRYQIQKRLLAPRERAPEVSHAES